jgi:endonuclease III related protein
LEIIVGAYLTQNTNWANLERALKQLRAARVLSLDGIRKVPVSRLESLIRSSGYFRQKAQRLKTFVASVDQRYGGCLTRMFSQLRETLRQELLLSNGVGPETADSILFYAGQHPVFLVDAYTRRILARHGISPPNAPHEGIRQFGERALSQKALPLLSKPNDNLRGAAGACHPPSRMSLANGEPLAQVYSDMHGLIAVSVRISA